MSKEYYFISDIHLGLESRERERKKERRLTGFLQSLVGKNAELFIVGDLFDYWFEYRRVYQKGYFRTLTALQDVVESGIPIYYIIGNHDFMHRDFFEKEIGMHLMPDTIERTIDGKKFFIAHGDGLVANDIGYLILKKILRNRFLQWLYGLVHPDLGIALASFSSRSSRKYTAKKDYGQQNSLLNFAKMKLESGFDYVIFGHSHEKTIYEENGKMYLNLGSWFEDPLIAVFREQSMEVIECPPK
jgi:UDP-2,3-diacylglucosamine hydrolase